jgi:hypothetical protein
MIADSTQSCASTGTPIEFEKYGSPYLKDAWRPDSFEIISTFASPTEIEVRLKVTNYFGQGVFPFHLSNIAASTWLQQMGVVLARWIDNDKEKSSFVDMIEFYIRCKKPINDTNEIILKGALERSRSMKSGILYMSSFTVQNGSYIGKSTFFYGGKHSLNSGSFPS